MTADSLYWAGAWGKGLGDFWYNRNTSTKYDNLTAAAEPLANMEIQVRERYRLESLRKGRISSITVSFRNIRTLFTNIIPIGNRI